jgi:hypothetical protein
MAVTLVVGNMKIKTSELTGAALDWAVAQCEGAPIYVTKGQRLERMDSDRHDPVFFQPSTDWSQGGAIIEREKISVGYQRYSSPDGTLWDAVLQPAPTKTYLEYGPTLLIAAMRCFVASKLGDEVEVPEEFCGEVHKV